MTAEQMSDREKILAEITRRRDLNYNSTEIVHELDDILDWIERLPAEPEPMVRWRTVEETPVGIDEEFHTSLEGAEEYLESMAGHYPSKITKVEIREVQNG